MKIASGLKENDFIVGNVYDKYSSRNPFVQYIMKGFHNALFDLVNKAAPKSIHEIGCGEGYWVLRWRNAGFNARGSDFSPRIIRIAQTNALSSGQDPNIFAIKNIYHLKAPADSADLIVCCEVFEHLENPELALQSMCNIVENHIIISVPQEPIWRVLNIIRGKYLFSLGNTPGHIQHWSQHRFISLVNKYLDIIDIKTPLPWIILLCQNSRKTHSETLYAKTIT